MRGRKPAGNRFCRMLDHSAIFLLIAGTYTPFTLGPLRGFWGATILALVWALAIFGVTLKATRGPSRHSKLGMTLYLGTGWLALIAIRPITLAIPFPCVVLAGSRWRRLYRWCALFREPTSALQPLHLAFVRPRRYRAAISSRCSPAARLKRGEAGLNRSDFSQRRTR